MMGEMLSRIDVPVVKACNGLLALSYDEVAIAKNQACIRCSQCVVACPVGLLPLEMASRIRANQLEAAVDLGLKDCISCGACSYICPSNIPLVHYFKFASGELYKRQQIAHKSEQTKRLVENRNQRIERAKLEAEEEARKAAQVRAQKAATRASKIQTEEPAKERAFL